VQPNHTRPGRFAAEARRTIVTSPDPVNEPRALAAKVRVGQRLTPIPFRTQPLSKRANGCNSNLVLPSPFHISAANLQQNSRKGCGIGTISALVDDRVSHAKWAILRMAVAEGGKNDYSTKIALLVSMTPKSLGR